MAITYPEGAQWPPKPYDRAADDMRIWQAWYAGNTDDLADIYGDAKYRQRMSATTGRLNYDRDVFFWGRPNPQGTKRRHVPAPANLSRAASDLLFSQPPKITVGDGDKENASLTARLETIFDDDTFNGLLAEAAETASVLGGVYLVPWWDKEIADNVIPGIRNADRAIPEWNYDRLTAVTFWQTLSATGDSPVVRHLERHERGKITHALYAGTENSLGSRQSLEDHPGTAWAAGVVNDKGEIFTGYDAMHVTYVPNVRPSRGWQADPILSRLGRSDYEGLEGEFDALDEVHTSWLRDVENAKSRIFVDETLLADDGPGEGGSFDVDRQIYTTLRPQGGLGGLDKGAPLEQVQFNIRVQEHADTAAEILQHILQSAGISAQQFSDSGLTVGVTATEISTRNAVSENTRQKKINYWTTALQQHARHVLRLDAIQFNTGVNVTDRINVKFPARAVQSEQEQAQIIATKRTANVISVKTAVQSLNPDWTSDEVDAEIERIRADQQLETKLAYGQGLDDGEDPGPADEGTDPTAEAMTSDGEDGEDISDYLDHAEDAANDAEQEEV